MSLAVLWLPLVAVALLLAVDAVVAGDAARTARNPRALAFLLAAMALLMNASGVFALVLLALFAVFYVTALLNYGFYRNGLQPELMTAIFHEREDIFLTLGGNLLRNLGYCLLGGGAFTLLGYLQQRYAAGGIWPAVLLLSIFVVQGVKAKGIHKFKPRKDLSVFENTFRAYQGFFFHAIPAYVSGANVEYVDVEEQIAPAADSGRELVVLVIGESIAAQRVSVFGYPRETTPFLARMQAEGRAQVVEGMASATSTVPATIALLLALNDPRDINGLRQQNGNLFRLAKRSGFRTHYLSAQRANVVDRIDLGDVDEMHTLDSDDAIRAGGERGILARMAALPAQQKHFVVVHMRVGHSPYDHYRKVVPSLPEVGGDPNSLENYEQSVRAVDCLLEEMAAIASGRGQHWDIFFTSDHGELFGEEGLYGHAMLDFAVARVPLAVISGVPAGAGTPWLARAEPANHYDLSCATAAALGWQVSRSGEDTGYVNGIGFAGASGLLTYARKPRA